LYNIETHISSKLHCQFEPNFARQLNTIKYSSWVVLSKSKNKSKMTDSRYSKNKKVIIAILCKSLHYHNGI